MDDGEGKTISMCVGYKEDILLYLVVCGMVEKSVVQVVMFGR